MVVVEARHSATPPLRMPRSALVVVILLALLGAGSFWLLSGGELAAPSGHGAHGPGTGAAAPAAAAVAGVGDAKPVAPAIAGDAAERERAEVSSARLAGGASVRGRLVDKQGAPRPEVALQLRDWSSAEEFEVFEGWPRERSVGGDPARPSWRTGADGRFVIPLRTDRSGQLELLGNELVFASEPSVVQGKKGDQDLGDLRVLRAGRIAGVVHDANGAPMAEIKVAADRGGMPFGGRDSTTTTDAAGRFEFRGLRPATWALRTASSKFLPTLVDVELGEEAERTDLVLVVRPGRAIAGQVVDERGVGVAGMKVGSQRKEARGGLEIERFTADEATTTDAAGFFTLAGLGDDLVTVRTHGPGHTSARLDEVQVGDGNVQLRVQRLGVVEGVLRGADGGAIAGSRVRVAVPGVDLEFHEGAAEEFDPMAGPDGFRGAETAADGSFRLENVRPGKVSVVANGSGHRPALQRDVLVDAGQVTRGVQLVAERGAVAKVTVVDDLGQPVADATVEVRKPAATDTGAEGMAFGMTRAVSVDLADGPNVVMGMGGEALGRARTDKNGVAQVTGLPGGAIEIVAQHERFAASLPATSTVPANGSIEVGVALRKAAFAAITVVDTAGTPMSGAKVHLRGKEPSNRGEPARATTDERGQVRFGPLPAGEHVATLMREPKAQRVGGAMMVFGGSAGAIPGSEQPVQLVAGQTTELTIRRPVATRLHGLVLGAEGPVVGCVVELQPRMEGEFGFPGGSASASTGTDGTFAIDDVAPGDYVIRFGRENQTVKCTQDVAVPAEVAEVRQDLQLRTGTLRARVVSSTGEPVAGAEVEVVAKAQEGAVREQRMMVVSMAVDDNDGGGMTTMSMGGARVRSGADGSVEVTDVPPGEWTLRIRHKQFAPVTSKPATVVERQVSDVGTLQLVAGGNVRGAVLGADGKPAPMSLVCHRAVGTEEWSEPEFAQAGKFRLVSLPPGRHQLRAQDIGSGAEEHFSPLVEVEVVAGQTATAELRLPAR